MSGQAVQQVLLAHSHIAPIVLAFFLRRSEARIAALERTRSPRGRRGIGPNDIACFAMAVRP